MTNSTNDPWQWVRENEERQWRQNMLNAQREANRQQQQQTPPQRTAPSTHDVGYAGGQMISRAAAGASAYAGAKAGKNHYALNGDLSEAAWRGAIAGRRWFVWGLGCVAWCAMVLITFCIMMGASVDYQDYKDAPDAAGLAALNESRGTFYAWLLSLPIVLVFLLVIYKRNIDFSLFKRRGIYDLAKAISPLFAWAPNWLLYAGFVVVPVTLQFVFI